MTHDNQNKDRLETGEKKKKKRKVWTPHRISISFECTTCKENFDTVQSLREHVEETGHITSKNAVQEEYTEELQALGGALKIVKFLPIGEQMNDMELFLGEIREDIMNYIEREVQKRNTGIKWYTICSLEFIKITEPGANDTEPQVKTSDSHLHSSTKVCLQGDTDDIMDNNMDEAYHELALNFANFRSEEGTGWSLNEVKEFRLYMGIYQPLNGSQYVQLPPAVQSTKAVVNLQNNDEKCFIWSVLAHLYPAITNPQRVTNYIQHEGRLNMNGIYFPVTINDIPKFEKNNHDISVNVFGLSDSNKVNIVYYPLYISKNQSTERTHVNLLLLEKDGKTHYCLIKDLNKMLYNQSKHKARKYFCTNCLHGFNKQSLLDNHKVICTKHDPMTIVMPTEENALMTFTAIEKMLKVPFVIYADFECVLVEVENGQGGIKNEHIPCGYSYLVVSSIEGDEDYEIETYSGANVMESFFENLIDVTDKLIKRLDQKKTIVMTDEDLKHFQNTNICHICEKFILTKNDKVKDHCHLTGKYRGPAHNRCNINYRLRKFIPVFFHNLEGYDSHLLMQQLGSYKKRRVSCIAKNMEKYISFNLSHIRFLDSLNFMNESLAKLVKNLSVDGDEAFHQIRRHFPNLSERALMLRKGVYPYEWMDSVEKMEHQCLPDKEAFYSSLTMQDISTEDYEHAQNVWSTFQMTCMKDYHDLYLKTDVLLLADCFENFRKQCLEFYKLDPAHFYTTPGLSWTAAMKMTGVNLELLTDIDMHLMVEKGVRGGVSTIVNRYCKANNKYMTGENGNYDPCKPSVYMLDLDANNLYGWAMSQPLPTGSFKWITDEEELFQLTQNLSSIDPQNSVGYIMEVDLEIPIDLHDHFNEYVPAPEHLSVTIDMLSPFNKTCMDKFNMKHVNGAKLIPNLYDKEKYVVHYRTLQCYLNLGLKLKCVHRAIEFKQRPWLREYIQFNTEQRKLARNDFEKNFFKLMNNSVFGKTIENLRNRTNIELVHTTKRFTKLMAKPLVESFERFNDNLVGVKLRKTVLKMNRPNYAGMVILDLAKLLMYDFYYNTLKVKYGNNLNLLFTDTDSLCVSVTTDDVYRDMLEMDSELDCSDYPVNHFLHSLKNKKVLGKFKDEMNGNLVLEYIGLRSKVYSIKWEHGCMKTCKGINKIVNKLVLKHDMYRNSLFQTEYRVDSVVRIGSKCHNLYTYQNNKISLSPYDDKRYVLGDKITTLAYGHYKIVNSLPNENLEQ